MNFEQKPSPEKFNIRKLTVEDAAKYRDLRLTALKTDPASFAATYEEESMKDNSYWKSKISRPSRSFYGAEEGNRLVSTATLMESDEHGLMITAVYTLPEFRNKNLSRDILEVILLEAKSKGAQKIVLNVNADNTAALNLYKKLGFKIVTTTKDRLKGDNTLHDSHLMEKDLTQ